MASAQAGSELEYRATTLLVGGIELSQATPALLNMLLFPSGAAGLPDFDCCEQRTYEFSHPHHERQGRKKEYSEKAPTHLFSEKQLLLLFLP